MIQFILALLFIFSGYSATAQWQTLNSGSSETLLDIHFLTQDYGATVGEGGTVLLTEDRGDHWTEIGDLSEGLGSVRVLGIDTIMVAGSNIFDGNVYLTVDGGANWGNVASGARLDEAGEQIFALGYDSLRVSANGGAQWQGTDPNIGGTLLMEQIAFANDEVGMIAGNISGFASYSTYGFRTEDGGANWLQWYVFDFPNADAWTTAAFAAMDTVYLFTNEYQFFQPSDMNRLVRMTDFYIEMMNGQSNWRFTGEVVNEDMPGYIYDAHFFNTSYGFAVSAEGAIFRTGDGGNSWTSNYSGADSLRSIFAWSEDLIFVVGANGRILRHGQVNATKDPQLLTLSLFPNPVKEAFSLQGISENNGQLFLFNELGQLLRREAWQQGETISVNALPPGNYQVELRTSTQRYLGKLAVVK
ncbi:MAG: hypothetical protein DHS20C18_23110 [Saprospiraceae bacterium]|nr:MAG: hypothetical protein DHS20C18_23110 [Saprospiraceae bacterium]